VEASLRTLQPGAGFTFDDNEAGAAWDAALSVGDVDGYGTTTSA
jgi:hypothetical protein